MRENPYKPCPVYACPLRVPPTKIFCKKHWIMLPWKNKQAVADCFEIIIGDVKATANIQNLRMNVDHAIIAVEEILRESRPTLHG